MSCQPPRWAGPLARKKVCACGQPQGKNGNCPANSERGLPLQCVGRWALEKHDYLRRYIEATSGARGKFIVPRGSQRPGGAAFIDLFAGPGRARTQDGECIDGSPLIAAQHEKSPFTKLILCELDDENIRALESRMGKFGDRVRIVPGDSNANVDEVLRLIPPHGLNIAFYDPFAPKTFKWETLKVLGRMKRMDLLIHFPTMGVKRNFDSVDIDAMVGCEDWRTRVKRPADTVLLFEYLRRSLVDLGYSDETVRSLPIKNDQGGTVYHLVYATKNPLGNKIWESVVKTDASGQRSLF